MSIAPGYTLKKVSWIRGHSSLPWDIAKGISAIIPDHITESMAEKQQSIQGEVCKHQPWGIFILGQTPALLIRDMFLAYLLQIPVYFMLVYKTKASRPCLCRPFNIVPCLFTLFPGPAALARTRDGKGLPGHVIMQMMTRAQSQKRTSAHCGPHLQALYLGATFSEVLQMNSSYWEPRFSRELNTQEMSSLENRLLILASEATILIGIEGTFISRPC